MCFFIKMHFNFQSFVSALLIAVCDGGGCFEVQEQMPHFKASLSFVHLRHLLEFIIYIFIYSLMPLYSIVLHPLSHDNPIWWTHLYPLFLQRTTFL